ncbi:MAG: hypothetical protein K6G80_03660 [Treponema sp.]|nr:hypothetical protein [Treponema sp.]
MKKVLLKVFCPVLLAATLFSCASTSSQSPAPAEVVPNLPEVSEESPKADTVTPVVTEENAPVSTENPAPLEASPVEASPLELSPLEAVPAEEAVIIEETPAPESEPLEAEPAVYDFEEPEVIAEHLEEPEPEQAERQEQPEAQEQKEERALSLEQKETFTEAEKAPRQTEREVTVIEGPASSVHAGTRQPFDASTQKASGQGGSGVLTAKEAEADSTQEEAIPPAEKTSAGTGAPASAVTPTAPRVAEGTVTQNESESDEDEADPAAEMQKEIPHPSRSVTLKKNQYLDIVYPGSGWVYLGETDGTKLFTYFGRKLGTSDTTFTLRSRNAGQTMLHFYKTDALTGSYIDDYLAITITSEPATTNEHVKAPEYASVVPPKPSRQNRAAKSSAEEGPMPRQSTDILAPKVADGFQAAETEAEPPAEKEPESTASSKTTQGSSEDHGVKTVIQTTGTQPAEQKSPVLSSSKAAAQSSAEPALATPEAVTVSSGTELLEQAKEAYKAKHYEQALQYVQAYLESGDSRFDEALYLQGQVLEADSPVKNIRSAIDSYETLTKRYPASRLWKDANKRAIYLKRFYIDIR